MRTDTIEGEFRLLPTIGEDFLIVGEGLEAGSRLVHTTTVKSIKEVGVNKYEFETNNSAYQLDVTNNSW